MAIAVMSLIELRTVDEALYFINSGHYGCLPAVEPMQENSEASANARNIGININIGVAAPMTQFPFFADGMKVSLVTCADNVVLLNFLHKLKW